MGSMYLPNIILKKSCAREVKMYWETLSYQTYRNYNQYDMVIFKVLQEHSLLQDLPCCDYFSESQEFFKMIFAWSLENLDF